MERVSYFTMIFLSFVFVETLNENRQEFQKRMLTHVHLERGQVMNEGERKTEEQSGVGSSPFDGGQHTLLLRSIEDADSCLLSFLRSTLLCFAVLFSRLKIYQETSSWGLGS